MLHALKLAPQDMATVLKVEIPAISDKWLAYRVEMTSSMMLQVDVMFFK